MIILKQLADSLDYAKAIQNDIISNHGEQLTTAAREEIVKVWNALDTAMIAADKALKVMSKPL